MSISRSFIRPVNWVADRKVRRNSETPKMNYDALFNLKPHTTEK